MCLSKEQKIPGASYGSLAPIRHSPTSFQRSLKFPARRLAEKRDRPRKQRLFSAASEKQEKVEESSDFSS
jgi:hypothetical protein